MLCECHVLSLLKCTTFTNLLHNLNLCHDLKFLFLLMSSSYLRNLTGIPYNECVLKIERPAGYPGEKKGTLTWSDLANGDRPRDPREVQEGTPDNVIQSHSVAVGKDVALALVPASVTTLPTITAAIDPATKPCRELFVVSEHCNKYNRNF